MPDLPDYTEGEWDRLVAWLEQSMLTGAAAAAAVVGPGKVAAHKYAEARAAALIGKRWDSEAGAWVDAARSEYLITDTVREDVAKAVRAAVEDGATPGELNARLFEQFKDITGRSLTIARTEQALAYNAGTTAAYKAQGVEYVEVVDGPGCLPDGHDDRADACDPDLIGEVQEDVEANGQVWSVDDAGAHLLGHPNCFPSGTLVLAPQNALVAAFKRAFEGEVVILRTAADDLLTCTVDHPILTDRGWVAAGELKEGDRVVRCTDTQRVAGLVDPDNEHVPAMIEQVVSAFLKTSGMPSTGMPVATVQLDGDGADCHVDVVRPAGALRHDVTNTTLGEHGEQDIVSAVPVGLGTLFPDGAAAEIGQAPLTASDGSMGGSGDLLPVLGRPVSVGVSVGLATGPNAESTTAQVTAERSAIHADALADLVCRLAGKVPSVQSSTVEIGRDPTGASPCDAHCAEALENHPLSDPETLPDALSSFAAFVEFSDLVEIQVVPFKGHVFNLQTRDGWFVAENIVTHNCQRALAIYVEGD